LLRNDEPWEKGSPAFFSFVRHNGHFTPFLFKIMNKDLSGYGSRFLIGPKGVIVYNFEQIL